MKVAISVPDTVFRRAERFARSRKTSRSALYALAIEEYLERHSPDEITESMNQVCEKVGLEEYAFAERAGRGLLRDSEW
jgi:predicted transcriptional regulator